MDGAGWQILLNCEALGHYTRVIAKVPMTDPPDSSPQWMSLVEWFRELNMPLTCLADTDWQRLKLDGNPNAYCMERTSKKYYRDIFTTTEVFVTTLWSGTGNGFVFAWFAKTLKNKAVLFKLTFGGI